MLCISQEVYVNQLPYFKVVRRDILDDLSKELGDVPTFGDELFEDLPSVSWYGRCEGSAPQSTVSSHRASPCRCSNLAACGCS